MIVNTRLRRVYIVTNVTQTHKLARRQRARKTHGTVFCEELLDLENTAFLIQSVCRVSVLGS